VQPWISVAISTKAGYGLVSLVELAAIYRRGEVLRVAEIAQRQGIPDRYLEQMLSSLRRGGILRSTRGPKGGYRLARPPAEIRVAEVMDCLEGESAPTPGGDHSTPEFRVLGRLEDRLEQASQAILAATTLQDLLDQREELARSAVMYFI
jgi:Rrf2 family protein